MLDDTARLARLEQALTEERRARLAAEARLDAAIKQLEQTVSDGHAGLVAAIVAEQHERERASIQQEADRKWLTALSEHINIAQREAHDGLAATQASQEAAQRQVSEWVAVERTARTDADTALAAMKRAQDDLLASLADRPFLEMSIRAEVLALSHLVDDLVTAVFPTDDAYSSPSPPSGRGPG